MRRTHATPQQMQQYDAWQHLPLGDYRAAQLDAATRHVANLFAVGAMDRMIAAPHNHACAPNGAPMVLSA